MTQKCMILNVYPNQIKECPQEDQRGSNLRSWKMEIKMSKELEVREINRIIRLNQFEQILNSKQDL